MKTKKLQLKNGMTVLLVESKKSPVISVQMWVKTGSADEKRGEEGISHFIEHLVFKGTRKFRVGEIASSIEGSGGELNAYTSFDQTVFYVTISKHFIDSGLLAISEMMGFPLFDKSEIDNEREVVIEEIKRGYDSLGRKASQLMFSSVYQNHPYGVPVIGFEKNIRKVSRKTLVHYFQSRYVPRNMFLVVSGDFETKEMTKKIQQHFSEFQDFKVKKIVRKKEQKQSKPKVAVESATFEQSVGYLAWRIPSLKHKDIPALDLLAMVLGQGDSSRLVQRLRIEKPLVNSVGSSIFSPQDPGVLIISFGYLKENLNEILATLFQVIEDFFKNPPTIEEINRALVGMESDKFYSVETVDGLARTVGSQWFAAQDLNFQEKYLQKIRKVTPAQILSVGKKYLDPKSMTVATVTNDDIKHTRKQLSNWVSAHSKWYRALRIKNAKISKGKPIRLKSTLSSRRGETEKIQLSNGVTLLMRYSGETHLVSAKAAFMGGLRQEANSQEGLTELLTRTWTAGTKTRTENEIYAEIEGIAASLSPVAGRNSIGLGIDVLSPFEKRASDLFLDVLTQPNFVDDVVERERQIQLHDIKSKKDSPAALVGRDFMRTIFSGHPYSRELIGNEESVRQIHSESIHKHWQKLAHRKNLTIVISGKFDRDHWIKAIEEQTKALGSGDRLNEIFKVHSLEKTTHTYTSAKKEQSHVMYGFRGLRIVDTERYALHVMQSVLAGQGGRLFIELRDKNSLAYSVSPTHLEGIETGYFGAYIGCSPEKVETAIRMLKEQFDRLTKEPVGKEELLRSQRYLVGRHDIDLQKTPAISSAILYDDIYGIDFNEPFLAAKKYFSVTPEDIQNLAKKIFSSFSVISVVGPNDPWAQ